MLVVGWFLLISFLDINRMGAAAPIGFPCQCHDNCDFSLSCVRGVCQDVCSGNICGPNTQCHVVDHAPVCSCLQGYRLVGSVCQPDGSSPGQDVCSGNICGPNSQCRVVNHAPVCSCLQGCRLVGSVCQPDGSSPTGYSCRNNNECDSSLTCVGGACQDVCRSNMCGPNSQCRVINHAPLCSCLEGYQSDGSVCQPVKRERFFVSKDLSTWNEARKKCIKIGGDLPIISSAQENQELKESANEKGLNYGVWLGGDQRDGVPTWLNGLKLIYSDWHPQYRTWWKGCMATYNKNNHRLWGIFDCSLTLPYACQMW